MARISGPRLPSATMRCVMASDSATGRSPPLARAVRRTVMFYDHRNLGEQGKKHRIRRLAICLVKTREFSAVSRFAEMPSEDFFSDGDAAARRARACRDRGVRLEPG